MATHLDLMMLAFDGVTIPGLHHRGFDGTFPHFRRKRGDRLDVLRVTIDDAGGSFVVDLGQAGADGLAQGDWTSLAVDEITVAHLDRAARYRLHPGFFSRSFKFGPHYYHPSHVFPAEFYERIARKTLARLDKKGEPWFAAPRTLPSGAPARRADVVVTEMLDALGACGWTIEREPTRRPMPAELLARYGAIPDVLRTFTETVRTCVRGDDEGAWLLTAHDYAAERGHSFHWDEWERMGMEASTTADLRREVRKFWSVHLPILQSVSGDYAYLALCLDKGSDSFGAIVRGDALDFEGTLRVAPSVHAFFELVTAVAKGDAERAAEADIADFILPILD